MIWARKFKFWTLMPPTTYSSKLIRLDFKKNWPILGHFQSVNGKLWNSEFFNCFWFIFELFLNSKIGNFLGILKIWKWHFKNQIILTFWKSKNFEIENYSKCRIWMSEFWRFPPIFGLLKLTCLVTLSDRKLQLFKNSPKWTIFGIFN